LAVLDAVKDAKLKTLRIFISHTLQNNKDTGSVNMPDIEPQQVGTYDDTQLRAIDQLMIEAHDRGVHYQKHQISLFMLNHTGVKLIIAMHDRYQLGCWGNGTFIFLPTSTRTDIDKPPTQIPTFPNTSFPPSTAQRHLPPRTT
jgi:mannan endo-1,4-beta-mannosidase